VSIPALIWCLCLVVGGEREEWTTTTTIHHHHRTDTWHVAM